MTTKANHADGERIMEAFKKKPARERNEVFAQHQGAYRLVEAMGAGHIDPAGLTEQGVAAVDAFAQAVGVEREDAGKPSKRAAKKDDSNV